MIDRIVCARGKDVFSDDYSSAQAVQDRELLNPDADRLAVLFPQWHAGSWPSSSLIKRLQEQNWAVLNYDFHDQILEPNVGRVLQSFENIQTEITADLETIQGQADYQSIHFIGMSLGNVAMSLVASEFPEFSSATFVTPGSKLASSMWEGARTRAITKSLSEQGVTKEGLEADWHDLAPIKHARVFKNKTVQTLVSTRDKMIPTSYQLEMDQALVDVGSNVSTSYSRLGHAASLINFCLFSGKI